MGEEERGGRAGKGRLGGVWPRGDTMLGDCTVGKGFGGERTGGDGRGRALGVGRVRAAGGVIKGSVGNESFGTLFIFDIDATLILIELLFLNKLKGGEEEKEGDSLELVVLRLETLIVNLLPFGFLVFLVGVVSELAEIEEFDFISGVVEEISVMELREESLEIVGATVFAGLWRLTANFSVSILTKSASSSNVVGRMLDFDGSFFKLELLANCGGDLKGLSVAEAPLRDLRLRVLLSGIGGSTRIPFDGDGERLSGSSTPANARLGREDEEVIEETGGSDDFSSKAFCSLSFCF